MCGQNIRQDQPWVQGVDIIAADDHDGDLHVQMVSAIA